MIPVSRRLEAIIDAAIDHSTLLNGRNVYVPLVDLYGAVEALDDAHEALLLALPYVESEQDNPAYKPGAVAAVVKQMRAAIKMAAA
jgi:meiotically up-regulated gene 157 (Mug157) protein